MNVKTPAFLILAVCASALASPAFAGFNDPITFAQAGKVSITLDSAGGGYDHTLELAASLGPIGSPIFYLATGGAGETVLGHAAAAVGATASLGSFTAGSELVFRLTNIESPRLGTPGVIGGQVFTGSASGLNDQPTMAYSLVEKISPTAIKVTLEDLFPIATSGTPTDFINNGPDVSFTLTLSPVPEPTSIAMALAGLGVLGATLAKRKG